MARIYIVEDEMLLAMLVEDMVSDLGHKVVGISQSLAAGLSTAEAIQCDLAILDINLNGELSFPVARTLINRTIPIMFASGYGAAALEHEFRHLTIINKPFSIAQLDSAIQQSLT